MMNKQFLHNIQTTKAALDLDSWNQAYTDRCNLSSVLSGSKIQLLCMILCCTIKQSILHRNTVSVPYFLSESGERKMKKKQKQKTADKKLLAY